MRLIRQTAARRSLRAANVAMSQLPEPDCLDAEEFREFSWGCSVVVVVMVAWVRRACWDRSMLGRATSKERAETTPGKDLLKDLVLSSNSSRFASRRWSLWVFFDVEVLPMTKAWTRWSQRKLCGNFPVLWDPLSLQHTEIRKANWDWYTTFTRECF